MKKIFLFLSLTIVSFAVIFSGCATSKNATPDTFEERSDYRNSALYIQTEAFLNEKRDDPSIYFGEGIQNIGSDIGEARESAKQLALGELSSKISVVVKSDIELIVIGTSLSSGRSFTTEEEETIKHRIELYTSQIITSVKGSKHFIDYPTPGTITYFVYISKEEYEEKVRNELKAKKNMIRDMILAGDRELLSGHYLTAVQNWIEAKNRILRFFDDLPVEGKLTDEGRSTEFNAYTRGRINQVIGNLIIEIIEGDYFYDAQGNLDSIPMVYVQYRDDDNNRHPVAGLPLKATFMEGSGQVGRRITTGPYGQVEIPVSRIDASNTKSVLLVEIDSDSIPGLSDYALSTVPQTLINLYKLRTVALSFVFWNGSTVSSPDAIISRIKSIILENSFTVADYTIQNENPSGPDFNRINNTNADYFLHIYIKAGPAKTAGGYENMFTTYCGGTVSLYTLPHGTLDASEALPSVTGFGSSAANAGWDGYGQLQDAVVNKVKQIFGRLQ